MKERNTLLLDRFLGVDFTTSPLKVDSRRAVSGKNFITDYGTMKKRPGWIEKYKFLDRKITGMFYYRGSEEFWLVRAGDKFYKVDPFFTSQITLYTTPVAQNEDIKFFYQDGMVYIIGCNKYLVMTESIVNNEPTYTISEVKDSAYVPTTTISIDDDEATNQSRDSLEPVNLLTVKRKNKLIGRNVINLTWLLDGTIREINSVISKVYVEIEYWDGTQLQTKHYETFPNQVGLEAYIFDRNETVFTIETSKGVITRVNKGNLAEYFWEETSQAIYDASSTKYDKNIPLLGEATETMVNGFYEPTFDRWLNTNGDCAVKVHDDGSFVTYWKLKQANTSSSYGAYQKLTLKETTQPPVVGIDNILVTFEAGEAIDGSGIFNATQGIVFGVNGTTNQLFLSKGNEEHYSKAYDFTYFPDTYTNYLGAKGNPIVGYERLSDTSLVIYKADRAGESRLFFRTLELVTDSTSLFFEYRLVDKAVDENVGCDAQGSIANLSGDHLFLSNQGVYAVTLGQNVAVEMRHARERGMFIKKKLESYSIVTRSKAKAIVHDNRYYLCIGTDVFVADARYRSASDMDDTFNYEWYFWDNIDAVAWYSLDGQLYFGTSSGRICVFDEEFADRTLIRATEGDVTLTLADGYLTYNQEITVKDNDRIKVSIHQKHIDHTQMVVVDGLITATFSVETIFYDGMPIYVNDDAMTSGLSENTPYYVTDIDGGSFRLFDGVNYVTPIGTFDVLEDISTQSLYVTQHDEVLNRFKLKKSENGTPITVINYTGQPITFVITLYQAVEMVWYTPIFDLGSNMWAKTLLGITISADASTTGAIDFGFDTRNISSNIQSLNYQSFTFDDIDFNNFTFLTAIASSYTIRVKEKDFNFIILKFGSKTPSSAVINNVTIYYKVNTMNRGIR